MSAQDGKGEPLGIPPVRDPRLGRAGVAGLGTSHAPLPPLDLPHLPEGDFEDEPGAAAVRPAGSTGAGSRTASSTGASSAGASSVPGAEPGTFGERLDRFQVPKRGAGLRSVESSTKSPPEWIAFLPVAGRQAGRAVRWCRNHLAIVIPWMIAGVLFVLMANVTRQRDLLTEQHARSEQSEVNTATESVYWSIRAAELERALRRVRMRLMGIPACGWSEPPWDPPNIGAVINNVQGDRVDDDLHKAEMLAPGVTRRLEKIYGDLRKIRPDLAPNNN